MKKCDCYHIESKRRYTYNPITGDPIGHDIDVSVCWGTKETDECSCGGDRTKCDFYPEVREKALKEQEPKFGEWISVEDRLPEECEDVLTYSDNVQLKKYEDYSPQYVGFIQNGGWYSSCDFYEYNNYMSLEYVTHWMPLPEPPKGE